MAQYKSFDYYRQYVREDCFTEDSKIEAFRKNNCITVCVWYEIKSGNYLEIFREDTSTGRYPSDDVWFFAKELTRYTANFYARPCSIVDFSRVRPISKNRSVIQEIQESKKEENKIFNKRELMLLGMNAIIMNLNNEDQIDSWLIGGVPDGADVEEICAMANDDDDFKYYTSLFLDIMRRKSAWDDGLYVSEELGVITADSRKIVY
jgi:hypothetical protein